MTLLVPYMCGHSIKAKDRIAQKLLCFTHNLDTKTSKVILGQSYLDE